MWQRCGWIGEISTAAVAIVAMVSLGRAASLTPVLQANPKSPGISVPNVLSVELGEKIAAQGSSRVENPMSVDLGNGVTLMVPFYGYDGDGPLLPLAGDVQTPDHNVEATKTEPDKNTYLVMSGQHGADPSYDYGTHFLYQGHEGGPTDASNRDDAAITRINLDADGAHRVTLLAIADIGGKSIPGPSAGSGRRRPTFHRRSSRSRGPSAMGATRVSRTIRMGTSGWSRTLVVRRVRPTIMPGSPTASCSDSSPISPMT
jgi:hypothetical protein